MQRIVATHVGVTDRGLQDVKEEIAGQAQSLKGLGNEFSNWAKETAKKLDERLNEVENEVKDLKNKVQQQADRIDNKVIPRIQKLESQSPSDEWEKLTSTSVTPGYMQCIHLMTRVLNQVTAKEFSLGPANRVLKKTRENPLYTECAEKINDELLKKYFMSAFESFSTTDENERGERLLLIQKVSKDLLRIFAPRVAA